MLQQAFIATTGPQKADSYSGDRPGYKYKNGPQGIGYYLEDPKAAAAYYNVVNNARVATAGSSSSSPSSSSAPTPAAAPSVQIKTLDDELMDSNLNEVWLYHGETSEWRDSLVVSQFTLRLSRACLDKPSCSHITEPHQHRLLLCAGTKHDIAKIIATYGFDERVASLSGAEKLRHFCERCAVFFFQTSMTCPRHARDKHKQTLGMPVCLSAGLYGAGIYFAEQSCKAAQYSPALWGWVKDGSKTKVQKANTTVSQHPPFKHAASAYQDRLGTDHKESQKGGVHFPQVMLISRVALGDVSYVDAKYGHNKRRRPPEKKRKEAGASSPLLFLLLLSCQVSCMLVPSLSC